MTKLEYKGLQIYQTPEEIKVLREELNKVKDIEGDVAEVGVFQGATALIIKEELSDKPLFLFDTFEGFPDELHETDSKSYKVGDCKAGIEYVTKAMEGKKDVFIYKGNFPENSENIRDKKFSFVHIDVDIFSATKNALGFFLSRMSKGGIIVVHDYPAHRGVKEAVDSFNIIKIVKGGRQAIIQL